MKEERNKLIEALLPVTVFVIVMWSIKIIETLLGTHFYELGVHPRQLDGIWGIVSHPFIHGDWQHLVSNTLPLLALGWMAKYFYPKIFPAAMLVGWLLTGVLVFAFARPTWHIGASGLVYALAFFLLISSLLRRDVQRMAIAFIIITFHGGLIWGLLPIQEGVSWEAHLYGAISGTLVAIKYRHLYPPAPPHNFDDEDEDDPFKYKFEGDQHYDTNKTLN